MDFTRVTPESLGDMLDAIGVVWSFDGDGDLVVNIRSAPNGAPSRLVCQMEEDFSMRGRFLGSGVEGSAIPAFKFIRIYFMPRAGHLVFQIHARAEFVNRPVHLEVVPLARQIENIESSGARVVEENGGAWVVGGISNFDGTLHEFVYYLFAMGVAMFEGEFGGWMNDGRNPIPVSQINELHATEEQIRGYV